MKIFTEDVWRNRMKVLHVITTINLGGAENHLYDLIREQCKLGYQITVVYLKGDHYWRKAYEALNVQTVCLEINNYLFLNKFIQLRQVIEKFQPGLIHAHMPPAELVTRLALIGYKSFPLIISKHNDEPFAPIFKNRFLANWVAKRASAIICISEAVKTYMSKWLDQASQSKLIRVYYSVDVQKFETARPAADLRNSSPFIIGTVARLTEQKSIPTLLRAFALFQKDCPESRLVIVGVGELEDSLKSLAQNLGLSKSVLWAGRRSDIPQVMRSFDVFTLTSIYEGFGLVLLEALAAEVPVVASNVSAIPEVLDGGSCGLLFPVQNENELAQCFLRLRSEELRKALASKGKQRVTQFFSSQKMVQATDQVYREVLTE